MQKIHFTLKTLKNFIEKWPVLSVSLYLAAATNTAFWGEFIRVSGELSVKHVLFSLSSFLFIILVTNLLLHFVKFRFIFKPFLVLILISSSAVAYFMNSYGIVIDIQMIHNTMETDVHEVRDLLNFKLLGYILFLGILPAVIISKLDIKYLPVTKQVISNAAIILLTTSIIAANGLVFSAEYTSLFKNNLQMRYLINPANYIYSSGSYLAETLFPENTDIVPLGSDAHQTTRTTKKNILVFVVGETARAQNFSLNGYNKQTNPLLSKQDIINYPNFTSCGTSTHVSLPCMFSHLGRKEFDESNSYYHEKLLDVLAHAGIDVLWRDNNSGCKGVCKRIKTDNMKQLTIDRLCNENGCYDEVLLDNFENTINSGNDDMVIILHQNGSHGPAYYLRYPGEFKKFTPTCETNELRSCSHESLVNSYDDTILYTDYFLSLVINKLKTNQDKYNLAMLYVSDHGESLGENNIYLHSMPYIISPQEQTHVPAISWFSESFLQSHNLDKSCLQQQANKPYSHDYLFHSILGLMNVSTSEYKPELDMYKNCVIQTVQN